MGGRKSSHTASGFRSKKQLIEGDDENNNDQVEVEVSHTIPNSTINVVSKRQSLGYRSRPSAAVSGESLNKDSAAQIVAKRRPPPMKIGFNEHGIKDKRKVLYRNFHAISGKIYLVEISRNKLKVYVLLFENFEIPTNFILEVLQEKVAHKLLQDNNNRFENFVSQFYIKFNRLQINGYHGKSSSTRSVQPEFRRPPLLGFQVEVPVLHDSHAGASNVFGVPKKSNFDQKGNSS